MKRKFKKGHPIPDINDLLYIVLKGQTIWYKDKPVNAEFILLWSIITIQKHIEIGNFYHCEEIE